MKSDCGESSTGRKGPSLEQLFYGTVTVGERGQVVIPAEARREYGFETGDKLIVMGHPGKQGVMMCKIDSLREFMTQLIEDLKIVESSISEPATPISTASHSRDGETPKE